MQRTVAITLLSITNGITTLVILFILHIMFTNTAIADPIYDQNLFTLYGIVVGLILIEAGKWIAFYQLVVNNNKWWKLYYLLLGILILIGSFIWSVSIFNIFATIYFILTFLSYKSV